MAKKNVTVSDSSDSSNSSEVQMKKNNKKSKEVVTVSSDSLDSNNSSSEVQMKKVVVNAEVVETGKRGKKACDISARTLFALLDKMDGGANNLARIRSFIDEENEEALSSLMSSVFKKNKSVTGKPGRPINPEVLNLLSERGVTVEALYAMDVKERKALVSQAHAHLKFASLNK